MRVRITLTEGELIQAGMMGVMRRVSAIVEARREPWGAAPGERWGNDIESCCAELAVAKAVDGYWHALSRHPSELEGDVGRRQVRWTHHANGGLIVHPEDKDHAPFFLVTGLAPTLDILGWMMGYEAKNAAWWNETQLDRPAYLVPARVLAPVVVAAGVVVPVVAVDDEDMGF
jgi:hypothetical protein